MSALQIWLQNHNRKLTQNAIDEALMEYIENIERQLAQANAVIVEQKETIEYIREDLGNHRKLIISNAECMNAQFDEQSELIEKLSDVLKCVDGGHTEPCWLGEMGKIEMWRVDEAISDYNQWKEQKC